MIVPLSEEMLRFRLEEEPGVERDWFVPRMRDYIALEPDGCFALLDANEPIGMVTSVCYDKSGWIGWLYVAEQHRYQGHGATLMRQAMGYCIGRGMRSVLLEAVLEAVPLYTRLGFRNQFRTQHYLLRSNEIKRPVPGDIAVRPIVPQDLDSIAAFDRRFFYDNRARALELLQANTTFSGFLAFRENGIVGYLGLTEAADTMQVGPFVVNAAVAAVEDTAAALVHAAFAANDKPLHFRCPLPTPERASPLVELGARPVDYSTRRMFMGDEYSPEAEGVLSLGCPGKG